MVGGSLCTPASSITKSGHHDIAEILLKVALNTIISINQSINQLFCYHVWNMTLQSRARTHAVLVIAFV
jgi:hypothetical protein